MDKIISCIANELQIKEEQVSKTVALMDEGNTIPFISRYRKEETGSLDDTNSESTSSSEISESITY